MKKTIYLLIILQFFSCKKNTQQSSGAENKINQTAPTNISENNIEFKYVTATPGLKYRAKPKGKTLGIFKYGERIEVIEHTNIWDSIKDNQKTIKGEWLGITINNKTFYMFGGYLSDKKIYKQDSVTQLHKTYASINHSINKVKQNDEEVMYQIIGDSITPIYLTLNLDADSEGDFDGEKSKITIKNNYVDTDFNYSYNADIPSSLKKIRLFSTENNDFMILFPAPSEELPSYSLLLYNDKTASFYMGGFQFQWNNYSENAITLLNSIKMENNNYIISIKDLKDITGSLKKVILK